MKAQSLIDACIESAPNPVVVELHTGERVAVTGYRYGENKRGEPVLVLVAGGKRKAKRATA